MTWVKRPGLVLVILLAIAGVRACLYAFVLIPPWQAPDEPGHYAYARELADFGLRAPTPAERAAVRHQIEASLRAESFWSLLRGGPAGEQLRIYFALVQGGERSSIQPLPELGPAMALGGDYLRSQRADEPPLYYLVPALLFRLTDNVATQLALARGWSVCLYLLMVAGVYWGLRQLGGADGFVAVVGGGLAALSPMPAFIGSSCNNDVAAMASATAALGLLLRGLRHGWTTRRLLALLALLVVASFTKKTTLFLWPLAAIVLVVHFRPRLRQALPWGRLALAGGALAALGLIAGLWPLGTAAGWRDPASYRLAYRTAEDVHAGRYALALAAPADERPAQVQQELAYNRATRLRDQELELTFWVRAEGAGGFGYASLYDGKTVQRISFALTDAEWQPVAVRYRLAADAQQAGIVLNNAGDSRLFFDDLSWRDAAGGELLRNGDFERSARGIEMWFARRRVVSPGLLPHLFEAQSYSRASLLRYALYAALTLAGAWANFGWLTLPLAPVWYLLIALTYAMAGLGLWRAGRRGWRRLDDVGRRLWGVLALALGLALLQTFLPMVGSAWQPQGRYLFPALLPAAALLARGWREWSPAVGRPLWAAYLLAGMFAFEQVCIWGYLVPRYAG